jgi:hypothetical protein
MAIFAYRIMFDSDLKLQGKYQKHMIWVKKIMHEQINMEKILKTKIYCLIENNTKPFLYILKKKKKKSLMNTATSIKLNGSKKLLSKLSFSWLQSKARY